MKYTLAIEEMEFSIYDCQNTIDNMYCGDFIVTPQEKEEAKKLLVNLACAVEVLKNNED